MKTAQKTMKSRWPGILVCLLAVCTGQVAADEEYGNGVTVDIDREVLGYLWVQDATVNLYQNAWIKNVYNSYGQLISAGEVWASSGAVLNIYGGKIDSLLIVTSSYDPGLPEANVTVYGREFSVNGVPVDLGTSEIFLQGQILSGLYENGTPFAFNVECFWEDNFYLTVKLGWIVGAPKVEMSPAVVEFGEVLMGDGQTATITVANTGNANLTLQSVSILQNDGAGFSFTPLGQLPVTIEPDGFVQIETIFAPSAEGTAVGILQIGCDDPENALVQTALTGIGLNPVLTAQEQAQEITFFYNESLANGTIIGIGPGKSARNKAAALGKMLTCAQNLINAGYDHLALVPLESAAKKTDGKKKPVDFVAGPAVPELNAMINDLISEIKNQ